MPGHRITRESGEYLADRRRHLRHQPPVRDTNTRPVASGNGGRLVRFVLTNTWANNRALANILRLDGTDTGIDAEVIDSLSIFASLSVGDPGFAFFQDGEYHVIQAPCP